MGNEEKEGLTSSVQTDENTQPKAATMLSKSVQKLFETIVLACGGSRLSIGCSLTETRSAHDRAVSHHPRRVRVEEFA